VAFLLPDRIIFRMKQYLAWMVMILLAAAALRLIALPATPPGLTHDEADHALSAWGVVNGVRPIYFTVGYGREPLYDYLTAGLMRFLGPTYLAGRLTSVYTSLILIAGMAAWTRAAFGRRVALFAAAGLAVGFWPLMTARQGLRSLTQPTLFVLALWRYWSVVRGYWRNDDGSRQLSVTRFILPALCLGLSFYTYIPARIMWMLFPLWLVYGWLKQRELARRMMWGTMGMLAGAAAIGAPLFLYLVQNPTAETRIGQLSGPLKQALQGDWTPLLNNIVGTLRLFSFTGDTAWRYNIAGKPWLDPVITVLFMGGLVITLGMIFLPRTALFWLFPARHLAPSAAFVAFVWLVLGLIPSLITGPELSTTQAIAIQPVLYLFPALGLAWVVQHLIPAQGQLSRLWPHFTSLVLFLVLGGLAFFTIRDYFGTWANHPEVRVQYETNLVETIAYVNQLDEADVSISTTTPGPFHSPAVAQAMLTNHQATLGWFNGQRSLLISPVTETWVTFSGFAPLSPILGDYFAAAPIATLPLRPNDLDRPVTIYQVDGLQVIQQWADQLLPAEGVLGNVVQLRGYALHPAQPQPGENVQIVTWWEILAPTDELIFFTHVVGEDGPPLAQDDRLDVPAPAWVAGDMFLQLHELRWPESVAAADYSLVVGAYYLHPPSSRLPVTINGLVAGDTIPLTTVFAPDSP